MDNEELDKMIVSIDTRMDRLERDTLRQLHVLQSRTKMSVVITILLVAVAFIMGVYL